MTFLIKWPRQFRLNKYHNQVQDPHCPFCINKTSSTSIHKILEAEAEKTFFLIESSQILATPQLKAESRPNVKLVDNILLFHGRHEESSPLSSADIDVDIFLMQYTLKESYR